MNRIALLACVLLPATLWAQADAQHPTPSEPVTKIVRVQYGDPGNIAHLASVGLRVRADADNTLRAIVIKGEPAAVAETERIIRELDVPATVPGSKDVELTVSVLGASSKPGAFPGAEVPQGLTAVVKQISAIFPYKSYQLLSSMLMRSRQGGSSENAGVMQGVSGGGADSSYASPYKLSFQEPTIITVNGKSIVRLRSFRLSISAHIASGPQSWQQAAEIGLDTDVDLPEGEKVVVGKANTQSSDSAIFVVLSARLVD